MSGVYCLYLPQFTPTSTNQLFRSVKGRVRLKKGDRAVVAYCAGLANIPQATGRRRVSLRITLPKGTRAMDPDNAHKSLADALKAAGLVRNDSHRWLEWGPTLFQRETTGRGTRETFVILEDLD